MVVIRADKKNNFEIQRGLQGACYLTAYQSYSYEVIKSQSLIWKFNLRIDKISILLYNFKLKND